MALNLSYPGCCDWNISPPCRIKDCYCDETCHTTNDCCSDIDDIMCHLATYPSPIVSPTPTDALGKSKSEVYATTI